MSPVVAALYVDPQGVYAGLPDVECWGLPDRDARAYAGPHPVVAHPPCARWCRLAGFVEARWGHRRGDDDGCFAAALAAVRRWGGALEHPAYSGAWRAHYLTPPITGGGWTAADMQGGWTCYVEQWRYGHAAKKATWLYACGVDLPTLKWGYLRDTQCDAMVSWCGNHTKAHAKRPRLGKAAAAATPIEFRDALLSMARTARIVDRRD
jgi:hypothetical protein